jgi:hypothetical protein
LLSDRYALSADWTQERALKPTDALNTSLHPEMFSSVKIQAIISSGFLEATKETYDNKKYTVCAKRFSDILDRY